MPGRPVGLQFLQRDELVEQAGIEIEPQPLAEPPVAAGDEAFAGGIGLAVIDRPAAQPAVELRLVGIEADAAVGDKFEVGPEPGEVPRRIRPQFGEPLEQQEQPARRAADRPDIPVDAAAGQHLDLAFPVGFERQLLRRPGEELRPGRHGRRGDAGKVAGQNARRQRLEIGTTAQDETPAAEHAAVRPGGEVMGQHVEHRPPVRAHHRPGDRDVFGDVARRAAGEREPVDRARPADIGKLREPRAPDVVAEGIVVPHRHSGLKVGGRPDARESVRTAEPGLRRRAHQFQQLGLLDGRRIHG